MSSSKNECELENIVDNEKSNKLENNKNNPNIADVTDSKTNEKSQIKDEKENTNKNEIHSTNLKSQNNFWKIVSIIFIILFIIELAIIIVLAVKVDKDDNENDNKDDNLVNNLKNDLNTCNSLINDLYKEIDNNAKIHPYIYYTTITNEMQEKAKKIIENAYENFNDDATRAKNVSDEMEKLYNKNYWSCIIFEDKCTYGHLLKYYGEVFEYSYGSRKWYIFLGGSN